MPIQVWATWFPAQGKPQTLIQEFPMQNLHLSSRTSAFRFQIGENVIEENSCQGSLEAHGHSVAWDLHYHSTFQVTLSAKGWIGFTRTPHSDARFSGNITFDGMKFEGDPLGFGVQGHNCGYRHRNFWTWTHAYFPRPNAPPSTMEALVYEMPLGFVFRKAILWHDGEQYVFRNLKYTAGDSESLEWSFRAVSEDGVELEATIAHRLSGNAAQQRFNGGDTFNAGAAFRQKVSNGCA